MHFCHSYCYNNPHLTFCLNSLMWITVIPSKNLYHVCYGRDDLCENGFCNFFGDLSLVMHVRVQLAPALKTSIGNRENIEPAYSITRYILESVSTHSKSRIILGWCSCSMFSISRVNSRWAFWSIFDFSIILTATFSKSHSNIVQKISYLSLERGLRV